MQHYVVDGNEFSTIEEFAEHFSVRVLKGHTWNGNLDAFNDILRGGFGTPEEGFRLVWKNSDVSRKRLSYAETARQLRLRLERCHPRNRSSINEQLAAAERDEGATVFDWLVEIIQDHGSRGSQSEDHVELLLQ